MKRSFPRLALVTSCKVFLLLALFVAGLAVPASAQAKSNNAAVPAIQGDLSAHDPALIKQGNTWYIFSTGGGIQVRTSKDLVTWTRIGDVFSGTPSWVTETLGNVPDLWAPDIHFYNGLYYLYYAGSSFGSNNSVIGLATNKTLDPANPNFHWVDHGLVIRSTTSNDYNTIDPNLTFDAHNDPWLAFGSFWSGLKLVHLDPSTMKPPASPTIYSLAERAAPDAIEASFIVSHGGYYYLFASVDFCCQGVNSTYKIAVGRASNITGPYYSEDGTPMLQGGYTILLQSSGNVIGPGGQSVYRDANRYLLVHHYYDGANNGAIKIQIRSINWTPDGWLHLSDPIS